MNFLNFLRLLSLCLVLLVTACGTKESLRMGYFKVDATPPIGSPVAYVKARSITDSLTAKGIVLTGVGEPIVIVSIDWIMISNEGLSVFKEKLAKAAGTNVERVTIHTMHQHDAPRADFSTEKLLEEYGMGGTRHDVAFLTRVMDNAARSLSETMNHLEPVTDISFGKAKVEKVASNRRILGPDGKVAIGRMSKSTDSAAIAAPEGVIDPWLKSVTFWSGDKRLATLSYYATHPQSYYGQGDVTSEYLGIAREAREKQTGVPQIFFVGAAGNVAAGKYNNGSPEMRPILASRIEKAMTEAWSSAAKTKTPAVSQWKNTIIQLPPAEHMKADSLLAVLKDSVQYTPDQRFNAARKLTWLDQREKGAGINISALHLGNIRLLHLPAEIFVEYQLAAQEFATGQEVCTAGYGEAGQGYIGTRIAYTQGGYEVEPRVSHISPDSEDILTKAIQEVLK